MSNQDSQVSDLQEILIKWGLVDPPVDGNLGAQTQAARKNFANIYGIEDSTCAVLTCAEKNEPKPIKPINDSVALVIEECHRKNYYLARGVDAHNIVYVEGVNTDFTPNSNRIDEWNDLRTILTIEHNGRAYFRNIWKATVNSGLYYTEHRLNSGGAANIEPGQYWGWQLGRHITSGLNHEALVQVRPIPIRRDNDENGRTNNDKIEDWQVIGVNQHGGQGSKVGRYSAGCLVVQGLDKQQEFVNLLKTDRRYKVNNGYIFSTIILTNNIFR